MPTKIEWADETFNPWWGCERVSPACAHCYADTWARRVGMGDLWENRGEHAFRFFGEKHWAEPLRWARTLPTELGRRPRVFCASMADVFEAHDDLVEPRRRLFQLIEATPELDWLILTKRAEEARDFMEDWVSGAESRATNIWLGVSIENSRFTYRAEVIRSVPAAVRFVSAEPLLGSLYPKRTFVRPVTLAGGGVRESAPRGNLDLGGIHWVIVGGESGPGARPFELEHAREVVRACQATQHAFAQGSTAVFVKQLGARPVLGKMIGDPSRYLPLKLRDRKGGDWDEWPADLRVREFPLGGGSAGGWTIVPGSAWS